MPNTDPFDQYSDRYDAWFDNHVDFYQAELEAIRQLMPSPPGKSLEIGVGSGQFAVPLGIETGVEPSESMALKAEARGIRVIRGVAEDLKFPDAEFDVVLMVTTICFVDDVCKSLQEAFRILKSGGCILVGFVDKDSQLGREYGMKQGASVFYRGATFFTADEVRQFLIETGLKNPTSKQTLIPHRSPKTVQDGYGKGAFVVIKGFK